MMAGETLVTVELRFVTGEDPAQLADRVRESVAAIVGKDALEEFRVKTIPLGGPKGEKGGLRPVE
jgi:acetylornithine deacetylase/succinyl-diaminopimelate desuccinylase-like protein